MLHFLCHCFWGIIFCLTLTVVQMQWNARKNDKHLSQDMSSRIVFKLTLHFNSQYKAIVSRILSFLRTFCAGYMQMYWIYANVLDCKELLNSNPLLVLFSYQTIPFDNLWVMFSNILRFRQIFSDFLEKIMKTSETFRWKRFNFDMIWLKCFHLVGVKVQRRINLTQDLC